MEAHLFYKFTLYLVQKGKKSVNIWSERKISPKIYFHLFTFYHGSSSWLFIQAQGELKPLYNTSESPVTNLSVSNLPTLDKQHIRNAVQMFQSPLVVGDCSVTIGGRTWNSHRNTNRHPLLNQNKHGRPPRLCAVCMQWHLRWKGQKAEFGRDPSSCLFSALLISTFWLTILLQLWFIYQPYVCLPNETWLKSEWQWMAVAATRFRNGSGSHARDKQTVIKKILMLVIFFINIFSKNTLLSHGLSNGHIAWCIFKEQRLTLGSDSAKF